MGFFNTKLRITKFKDPYIRFKLFTNFIFAIAMALVMPIATYLKGNEFKDLIWLLPFFGFLSTLSTKFVEKLVHYTTIQFIHKSITLVTFLFVFVPFIYTENKFCAALYTSILSIIDTLLALTSGVFFTNYLTIKNSKLISEYQTSRIHIYADGALVGGVLAMIVSSYDNDIIYMMYTELFVDLFVTYIFIVNYKLVKNLKPSQYKIKTNKV